MWINRTFSALSTHGKLVLLCGLILMIVCGVLTTESLIQERSLVKRAAIAELQAVSKTIASQIASAVQSRSSRALEQTISNVCSTEAVRYIVLVDQNGSIVSASDIDFARSFRYEIEQSDEEISGPIYRTVEPIVLRDKSTGKCYVGLSTASFSATAIPSNHSTTLMIGATLFVLGLIGVFAASSVLTRPLRRMVKAVEAAARGNLDVHIEAPFDDELKQLAQSFHAVLLNGMATHLRLENTLRLLSKREHQLEEEAHQRELTEQEIGITDDILNKTSALILVVNSRGEVEYASPSFEHVLGYKPDDLLREGWWKMSNSDVMERIRRRSLIAKCARHEHRLGETPDEQSICDARGDVHWILWQHTAGPNKTLISVGQDITERKRTEEQIREQAALLDITVDAIIVRTLDHRILFWNRGAERLYGWTSTEAVGRLEHELFQQDTTGERGIPLTAVIENGQWNGELRQTTHDGRKIVVVSRWTLMNDTSGKPKSILVVNTDMTEQKQLELQFRRAQRLENIGTLAGGIAHDLNNVLTPVAMSIQVLQKLHKDERTQQLLSTIESSAKRGADIVKQVLAFARGTEGERSPLQPKHILRELEKMVRETFPRSIKIETDIRSNLWTITGDTTQLHQIVLNLLVNARDAMPNGGMLTLRAENVTLDDQGAAGHLNAKPGDYVVLSVTDTGTGIPSEIMDKIFDPFFTTKPVGKGTGLGLSTVMAIVKSYNGFITIDSTVGQGTTFKVFLPATNTESSQEKQESRRGLPSGRGEWILVVDDEVSIRQIIKETLEAYGYRVQTAKDGIDALTAIENDRNKFHVVLTDMMMPNMDGGSLIRTLGKFAPHIPVIAISGIADQSVLKKIKKSRIEAFLPKPIQTENLLEVLDSALHNHTTRESTT